ncbi:Uncharacterized protein FWK35_00000775 [Aphis craccivora]|uniref:Uncharacterized protein n=1 Tax=Aphis craccivora TaxID=307492 RepID=A0A6G0ZM09_APHCR|nr:Uncharacterized protein FWK35_00000775 [Aphis craccivora]
MKIWFNFSVSAVVAIIFVVSLASAKNVLSIADNQSRKDIPSVKQSSDRHSIISYNDYVEKSTTDTTMDTTWLSLH